MIPPTLVSRLWAGGIFDRPHLLAFLDCYFFTIAIACYEKQAQGPSPALGLSFQISVSSCMAFLHERSLLYSCYRPSTPGHRFRRCGMTSQVPYDNSAFQLQHTAIIHRTGRLCKQSTISQLLFNILQF